MTKASDDLQDLRRRIYVKAKADTSWHFWGLYVHVCKLGTLREAYRMAKRNDGAPGIDGVTFEAIEQSGAEAATRDSRQRVRCVSASTNVGRRPGSRKSCKTPDSAFVRVHRTRSDLA